MPDSLPVRYTPLFEPYFSARVPVPPFDEVSAMFDLCGMLAVAPTRLVLQFYRGRGHSKTSWFIPAVRCGRLSLHVLGNVFLVSGEAVARLL